MSSVKISRLDMGTVTGNALSKTTHYTSTASFVYTA